MKNWFIVTGHSKGLGKAIALVLLEKGYNVIGISRSISSDMGNANHEGSLKQLSFDFSEPQQIKEFYFDMIKPIGPLGGLVNNAAIAYDDISTNIDILQMKKMFDVNVFSPIMLAQYVIRDMLLHEISGSIVHVSSICESTGYKGLSMYAATKGALESFSKGIAREWGIRGIRSNCVAPGFMDTRMSSSLSNEQRNKIYHRTCLRQPTDPISVAHTVEFLLSEKSVSITSQTYNVDSGTL